MSKRLLSCFSLLALAAVCQFAQAQDTYIFDWEPGPDKIEGSSGAVVTEKLLNTLIHSGPGVGAQGWSFSVTADGAAIVDINTGVCNFPPGEMQTACENDPDRPDTKTIELFFGGFEQSELTTAGTGECEGLNGAVSGVTLSFAFPVVLPPNDTSSICQTTIEITLPQSNGNATVRYVDQCQGGGQPIETIAVQDGLAVQPTERREKVIPLDVGGGMTTDCADYALYFGDDAENDLVATGGAQSFDLAMRNLADVSGFELAVENAGGALAFVDDKLGTDPDNIRDLLIITADGAQLGPDETNGASIDSDIAITDIRRKGSTAGSDDSTFFGASILDGTAPETGVGFVLGYLDLTPDQSIVISPTPTPAEGACPLNVIAEVEVGGVVMMDQPFNRGDVNADGRHNIADAAAVLRTIFGAPLNFTPVDCQDMLDVDANGTLGVGDGIFLLNWLFTRGARPADPFKACAQPAGQGLGCEVSNCAG